jgi:hypothetical protein
MKEKKTFGKNEEKISLLTDLSLKGEVSRNTFYGFVLCLNKSDQLCIYQR